MTTFFPTLNPISDISVSCISGACHQIRKDGYSFASHLHKSYEFYRITSGKCYITIMGREICAQAEDIVLILPNIVHSFSLKECPCVEFDHIHFEMEPFSGIYINDLSQKPVALPSSLSCFCNFYHIQKTTPDINTSVQHIIQLFEDEPKPYSVPLMNVCLAEMFLLILQTASAQAKERSSMRIQSKYISFVLNYISEHYHEKILISDISKSLDISEGYLSKIFSNYMSVSLANYINIYRINRAIQLMSDPDLSLTDIAFSIGLKDSQHFSKLFYKVIGMTPNKYRKINFRR